LRDVNEKTMPLHEDRGAVAPVVTPPLSNRQRARTSASEPALNVLVIEDTPEDRKAVRLALEAGGFVLQEAADAERGLKLAGSSRPDCILLDYALPDAEGLEVLESLRRPDGTLPCAVVMLTSAGAADIATAAMKAGACDYLIKDRIDAEMLRRAIGSAVRHFRLVESQRVAERHNAQLAAIVAASDDAIISLGTDFVVQTWNAGAQRLFGYDEAEAHGHILSELIVPDVFEAESAGIHTAVVNGGTVLKELLRRHKNGQLIPVEINTSPILDGAGRVTGTSIIYRDISERRRTEEAQRALADSEARFRVTFENAPVGIAHVARDGRWLRVNRALCFILGYPAAELTRKSFQDITHPDDLAASVARVQQMRDRKTDRYDADKRYLRKDGTIVWVRLTVSCVRKSDGSIDYLVTVVEDISARKLAEEELRKSEERFRSSLLHSPLPVLLYDDREQILAVSQSWLEKTGYSREELRCIEDWTARAYGERSDKVLAYIRQIISTEPEAQPTELIIHTKDGRERLWSFVASALGIQSDGRRLFVSMAHDATEQKAHEEQVHLLMREVSHRAKNMLSLVQAIARQTAAREPEDFVERFAERIQALAANQDLLVRNEWQGVNVEDIVRTQLAHFADVVGSRIAAHGPKLRLSAAAAQAIGLALHELATNAGKYGALSTDAGHVDVGWQLDGDSFAMSWTERNGPPVSWPERRGFGSTVIDAMAKRTVGGEVHLDYAPSGLVWRLMCPAVNALEQPAN
jgi:PAS domain S-box-containing protein